MDINNATERASAPTIHVDEIKVRINNIDIQPAKNWRETAPKGTKSQYYKIGCTGVVNNELRFLNVSIDAIRDGKLVDIGKGVPRGKSAPEGFIVRRGAKMTGLDSAKFLLEPSADKLDKLGQPAMVPVRDADGKIVYSEAPIPLADGTLYDFKFGTQFFCHHNNALTLQLQDCLVKDSKSSSLAPDGLPYLDIRANAVKVIAVPHLVPQGDELSDDDEMVVNTTSEAARKDAAAVADSLGGLL